MSDSFSFSSMPGAPTGHQAFSETQDAFSVDSWASPGQHSGIAAEDHVARANADMALMQAHQHGLETPEGYASPAYDAHSASENTVTPNIQAKLTVGAVDDPLEAEADEVADQVMRSTAGQAPAISPVGSSLQRESVMEGEEDEEVIQKESLAKNMSASSGQPLSDSSLSFFNERFGRSFDGVQVHTDSAANEAAESIQAKAFTSGNHIYFNRDYYRPDTESGKHLMAHELTHVVQQGGGQKSVQREAKSEEVEELSDDVEKHTIQREPTDMSAPSQEETYFDIESAIAYNKEEHSFNLELIKKINAIAQDPLRFEAAKSARTLGAEFALLVRSAQLRLYPQGPAKMHDGKLGPDTIRLGEKWLSDNPEQAAAEPGFFEKAAETVKKLGYIKMAVQAAGSKIWPSIKKEVGDSAREILAGLAFGLLMVGGILAATTLIGAIAGAFFGGVGAAPGAAIGFQVGVFLLKYLGLAFIMAWIGSRLLEVGANFWAFLTKAWQSEGNPKAIDKAAQSFATSIGVFVATALEVLVTFGAARGVSMAGSKLKGTRFAKWIGRNPLVRWLRLQVLKRQRSQVQLKREQLDEVMKSGVQGPHSAGANQPPYLQSHAGAGVRRWLRSKLMELAETKGLTMEQARTIVRRIDIAANRLAPGYAKNGGDQERFAMAIRQVFEEAGFRN